MRVIIEKIPTFTGNTAVSSKIVIFKAYKVMPWYKTENQMSLKVFTNAGVATIDDVNTFEVVEE